MNSGDASMAFKTWAQENPLAMMNKSSKCLELAAKAGQALDAKCRWEELYMRKIKAMQVKLKLFSGKKPQCNSRDDKIFPLGCDIDEENEASKHEGSKFSFLTNLMAS